MELWLNTLRWMSLVFVGVSELTLNPRRLPRTLRGCPHAECGQQVLSLADVRVSGELCPCGKMYSLLIFYASSCH